MTPKPCVSKMHEPGKMMTTTMMTMWTTATWPHGTKRPGQEVEEKSCLTMMTMIQLVPSRVQRGDRDQPVTHRGNDSTRTNPGLVLSSQTETAATVAVNHSDDDLSQFLYACEAASRFYPRPSQLRP